MWLVVDVEINYILNLVIKIIQEYLATDNIIAVRNTIGNIITSVDEDIKKYIKLKKQGDNVDYEILLLKMFKDDLKNLIQRYVKLDIAVLGENCLIKVK